MRILDKMPAKHAIKIYVEDGCYHLYNCGVNKQKIFLDNRDYRVFLHFLKKYLSPPDTNKLRPLKGLGLYKEIDLLTFCLMPNHFHLLIKQKSKKAIEKFMRSLATSYVVYFNKRRKRSGHLFQGRYKAVLIESDEQLLHLSRYIHLNPLKDSPSRRTVLALVNYSYSSYADYLGKRKTPWVKPNEVLSFFQTAQKKDFRDIYSYQSFVEDYTQDSQKNLGDLILEYKV